MLLHQNLLVIGREKECRVMFAEKVDENFTKFLLNGHRWGNPEVDKRKDWKSKQYGPAAATEDFN